jgi:DNA-binding beta-propeller fold protein YncE
MAFAIALLALAASGRAWAASPYLQLEASVPLGAVHGRIDHLALDAGRRRVFVAELGNGTVGVVDLEHARLLRTLAGFDAPQGIAFDSARDALYVANGGDAVLHVLRGEDLTAAGHVALDADADNVRIDEHARHVLVGHGHALAIIDGATNRRVGDVALQGHPEAFQQDAAGTRLFVNVPEAGEIAVVDLRAARQVDRWPTGRLAANYPLSIDEPGRRLLVAYRRPAVVGTYRLETGALIATIAACADADDLYVDPDRRVAYVICGEGFVDVLDLRSDSLRRLDRIPTAPGARTGLLVRDMRRLIVAVPARENQPASLRIFRLPALPASAE